MRDIVQHELPAGPSYDKKLESLVQLLHEKKKLPNKKVIIFTTYADTADYLFAELGKRGFEKMAKVKGDDWSPRFQKEESRRFEPILERFAPYTKLYLECDWSDLYRKQNGGDKAENFEAWKQMVFADTPNGTVAAALQDEIDILIATDCLSEGQNLQDADMVVNYDIHWNPVRLVQRLGRIDRIGSPNTHVQGVNYWPAASLENYLKLRGRVNYRIVAMELMGGETTRTDQSLEEMMRDNPLISEQERKFYEQMKESWDGIDAGAKSFGFDDLSLEIFRQELLEELAKDRNKYEKMPLGVFSGLQLANGSTPTPGLVALLGYPKRPAEAKNHIYTEHHLLYGSEDPETYKLLQVDILTLLRQNKGNDRYATQGLDHGKDLTLAQYKKWLSAWETSMQPVLKKGALDNLFETNAGNADIANLANVNERANLKNLDLLAWMEMNPIAN